MVGMCQRPAPEKVLCCRGGSQFFDHDLVGFGALPFFWRRTVQTQRLTDTQSALRRFPQHRTQGFATDLECKCIPGAKIPHAVCANTTRRLCKYHACLGYTDQPPQPPVPPPLNSGAASDHHLLSSQATLPMNDAPRPLPFSLDDVFSARVALLRHVPKTARRELAALKNTVWGNVLRDLQNGDNWIKAFSYSKLILFIPPGKKSFKEKSAVVKRRIASQFAVDEN